MNAKAKKIIKRTLKVLLWTVVTLVVLVALVLWAVVWAISPENLTKYAEQAVNEYLDAKVEIGRLELTAYSTFPILHVDIDSLKVTSGSLKAASDVDTSSLPADASHLVSLSRLHFSMNLAEAMIGRIDVKDITVKDLDVNIVEVSPTVSNYAIVPVDDVASDTAAVDTAMMELPWIRCKQVVLEGTTRLAYYSAPEVMSADIVLDTASIYASGRDKYKLKVAGIANCSIGGESLVSDLPFNMGFDAQWSYRKMMDISVTDLQARMLDIPIVGSMTLLAEEGEPLLQDFALTVDSVRFASVLPQLPAKYRRIFSRVRSNLMASIDVKLNEPYVLTSANNGTLPSMSARLVIPDSYWHRVGRRGRIDRLALDAQMEIDGQRPNASVVTLNNLVLNGVAVKLQLSGRATNLFADPHVTATLNGYTDLGVITSMVNVPLNFTVTGEAEANASVDMAMSNLNKENFHKVKLEGSLGLRNIVYDSPLDTLNLRLGSALLTFGNQGTYVRRDSTVGDDLLSVKVRVDTLDASIPGIMLSMRGVGAGAGAVGLGQTDTTQIVPMGFNVSVQKVRMRQADGTFFASRGVSCRGSVSRFRGLNRVPVFYLGFGLDTLFYRDNSQFVYLKDSKIDLVANRRVNMRRINRTRQLIDTLRSQHPDWSNDSLLAVVRDMQARQREAAKERRMRRQQRGMRPTLDDDEVLDMSVDSGFARLLARWQVGGRIRSNTGAMYTPYFPVRNRITNVDVKFNADSLTVESFNYKVGRSNFSLRGKLKNIRSTMMGSRRRPLDIAMILKADTIDVNQLVKAAADGMTYSGDAVGLNSIDSTITDIDELQQQIDVAQTDTASLAAFVVPRNIEAKIAVRSNNITFADMNFNKFDGNLFVHDGVVNLNELKATSDIGSARFNAMYASTDRQNIKFGMDLELNKIRVKEFINMIPAIDSVMPLLQSVDGIIDADLATTANLDSVMNIDIPSLRAAVKLHGDSLVFMDAETFKKIAKMLRFKNRERNMIDEMTVELLVENSQMLLYPFMFNVDRYRLGVLGYNDLDLNFRYHISVLKSPIPFKFGINIYGNPDDMHFRFGGAKYKEDDLRAEMVEIVDTTRINLREQINSALRRGANAALRSNLRVGSRRPDMRRMMEDAEGDKLTAADSLQMIQEGLIERPDSVATPVTPVATPASPVNDDKQQDNDDTACLCPHKTEAIKPRQATRA